jgi:hypothetical protein
LDWRKVNPPWVRLGGVGAGDDLGVGSLILSPDAFFLTTFCNFFGGGGVAAALHLLAWVLEDPKLWPFDKSLVELTLKVRAETRIARIGESPLKPGMGSMKLSRAYNL